jgi:hypothetical protein
VKADQTRDLDVARGELKRKRMRWGITRGVVAIALLVYAVIADVGQLTRWYYKAISPNEVFVGQQKILVPKGFFVHKESLAPQQYVIGGFYESDQAIPTDIFMAIHKVKDVSRSMDAYERECERFCKSFSVNEVAGVECKVQERPDGYVKATQILNVFCGLPRIDTIVSYHGSFERYAYFEKFFDELVRVGDQQGAASAASTRDLNAKK